MKSSLLTWMVALGLLATINNVMRIQASKVRKLTDNELVAFVGCCIRQGCPSFINRKHRLTCRAMYIGKMLSCRCFVVQNKIGI